MIIPDNTHELEAHPLFGLLIFGMKQPYHGGLDSLMITKHQLQLHNGRPVLGEVQHFSEEDLGELLRAIEARDGSGVGLIPSNLLFQRGNLNAWYVPGTKRDMWIQPSKGDKRLMSLKVVWPNLIFITGASSLSVFAYIGHKRPTEHTPLYHAPLMNVGDNGLVCLGDSTAPKNRGLDSIPEWEAIMFNTRFSHTNHSYTLRVKGAEKVSDQQHIEFWRSKASSQSKVKASELQPYHRNLGDLLQWMQLHG